MISNVGTHTLTYDETIKFNSGSSRMAGKEGYASGLVADKVVLGTQAKDFWTSQSDEMQNFASANGKTVGDVLSESISWNAQGWRSGSVFLNGDEITPDNTQLTYTERNTLTTSGGLKVDVAVERGAKDTILNSTLLITRTDGSQISFEATGDVRIQETADGSLLVTHLDTGKSIKYMNDGTRNELEDVASLFDHDRDTTYIKLTQGSDITAGNGNDSIMVIAGGGNITAAGGNDNIVIGSFAKGQTNIDAGDGDDSINAGHINDGISINMGAGQDKIIAKTVENGAHIDMGEGNDAISVLKNEGIINLGSGNNKYFDNYSGQSGSKNGKIIAGDGDNQITSRMAYNIHLGNGNNTILSQFMDNVNIGDGNNVILSENIQNMNIGNGDNNVESTYISNATIGNGNNTIVADALKDYGTINMGDGNNDITVRRAYRANLNIGNGNNNLELSDTYELNLTAGHGHNHMTVGQLRHRSNIDMGDGSNDIVIKQSKYQAGINLGDGNNILGIGNIYGHETTINIGDGNNILALMWSDSKKYGDTTPPSVTLGNGNNQIYLEQNFAMNLGTGNNLIRDYAQNTGKYNAIQAWIDGRISKLA